MNGFHRRRVRQRPRDVRRPASPGRSRACWWTTTTACARATSSCSSTRSRTRCRSTSRRRPSTPHAQTWSPPRRVRAASSERRAACGSIWSTRSRTWTTRSRCCVEGRHAAIAEGDRRQSASGLRPRHAARRDAAPSRKEEFDRRKEALLVAQAQVEEALQGVYQVRVAWGFRQSRRTGDDLAASAAGSGSDLFLGARGAGQPDPGGGAARRGRFVQQVAAGRWSPTSTSAIPQGDIDRIYAQLLKDAPAVKQAEAKLAAGAAQPRPGQA